MKLLELKDYRLIFLKAGQFDTVKKIAAYFEGKFSEVKDSNPIELYLDGLNKAFLAFEHQLKKEHHEEMRNFSLSKSFESNEDYEKPDINNNWLPAFSIHPELTGHYNHRLIHRIKKGFDKFHEDYYRAIKIDDKSDPFEGKDNIVNKMPLEEVYEYFKQLTLPYDDNEGEAFLTEKQVLQFVYRAFCGEVLPKISMNLKGRLRGAIIDLFYTFRIICHNNGFDPKKPKTKYAKLLGDNFEEWTLDGVYNNFRRSKSLDWPIKIYGQFRVNSDD